jgi:hypothetical protein
VFPILTHKTQIEHVTVLMQILAIDMTIRNACITGDLTTAEQLLTQEIDVDANSCTSYANRSFVMARQLDWDRALHDANKVSTLAPPHGVPLNDDRVIVC